jgi:hypothetical protein
VLLWPAGLLLLALGYTDAALAVLIAAVFLACVYIGDR